MIEAIWLKTVAGGVTEVWMKCGACHNDRCVLSNHPDSSDEQPFFMCLTCGKLLYEYELRQGLVAAATSGGWSYMLSWMMAQGARSGDVNLALPL